MAECQVVGIAIVQAIIVGQLLASLDIPNGANHDFAIYFVRLAIGIARVIDEGSDAIAINHALPISQSEEISARRVFVNRVGFSVGQPRAGVLGHNRAPFNRGGGVNAIGMNLRSANDESHVRD